MPTNPYEPRKGRALHCISDVEGPWKSPKFDSTLVGRLQQAWSMPVAELTNSLLATCLRQRKGLVLVLPEAEKRLAAGHVDGTEMYEEELAVALALAIQRR